MLQQLKIACALHLWARALAWLGLLGLMLLLLAVSGGFPPQAWMMLAQSLPLLGHLLAVHGLPALASFAGILLLSLTWGAYWAMLVWAGIGLLRAGRQTKRAPTKTNWRRNSADNLLEQGFDEPQASLAYAALTRAASPIPPPPSASLPQRHTGNPSQTLYGSGDPRGRHAPAARLAPTNHVPTSSYAPAALHAPAPSKMATRPLASTLPTTTGEYERAESIGQRAHSSLTMGAGVGWDPGITRKHKPNEDAVLAVRSVCDIGGRLCPIALYVVADGMGGHASGRLASHLATRSLMQSVLPAIQQGEELDDTFLMETLTDCVHQANAVIHDYREEHDVDLGTTITATLLVDSTAYIVNVGDSRTYIYRQGEGLTQITRDHSLVARLVAAGAIAAEDVYTHPDRNKIYRGLGEKDKVQVDWFIEPLHPGDYVLLCSDGLWEMVRDHEIEQILKRCLPDVAGASEALIKAALHRGGADNVSVIVAPV